MKHVVFPLVVFVGLLGTSLAPLVKADPVYKRTEVTFHQPVEIPGMVLTPGTYVMKLLDPGLHRNVVRFYNADENHMYAMVFAVPAYRLVPPDHTVITFEERAANAPQAIKEWFPAGEHWGEEFVYPKPHPIAASVEPAPLQTQPREPITPVPAPLQIQPPAARVHAEPAPLEIAQTLPEPVRTQAAEPAATTAEQSTPPPAEELPKTASDLPMLGVLGGLFLLTGVILRGGTA